MQTVYVLKSDGLALHCSQKLYDRWPCTADNSCMTDGPAMLKLLPEQLQLKNKQFAATQLPEP